MKKIGVEALFLTAAFVKGVQVYNKGLDDAKVRTEAVAVSISQSGQLIGGKAGIGVYALGEAFGVLAPIAVTAGAAIVGAMAGAAVAVAGFASAMISLGMQAQNMENIEFAFERMAGTVDLSLAKMREATAGTIADDALLVMANKALIGSSEPLAQAFGQDLPRIMEMARVAAKTTGISFEEAMNKIIMSVKRGTARGLVPLGITVDVKNAVDEMGDSFEEGATSTAAQAKQLAVLNSIMEQSDNYIKTFTGSNEALAEKVSRAKAIIDNIKDSLGQFFTPALKTAFDAINRLLSAFDDAIKEGGALYNTFVRIAAVFSLVADGFSAGVDMLLGTTTDAMSGVTDTIADAIDAAFDWGLNLVINFAQGIINGAASVLQGAINFISGMLSGWFSANSPPKVAPNIDKWGADTMSEFLHGFEKADFSILKALQSPLKSILDTFASNGLMSKVASKEAFLDISKAMISGLAGGDLSSAFSKITKAAGSYGIELIKMIKLNQQLAAAQKAVAAAEKAIADSKRREEKLNADLQLQLMEYNDLARAGASPEVLAAKLAGVNITEDALLAAQSETKAAEESKIAADEQMDTIKEQVDLQKELIDVLIDLAKAQDDVLQAQKEAAKAGAGAKGAAAGGAGLPLMDWTGTGATLQDTLTKAIENAKFAIRAKLLSLWDEIKQSINNNIIPAISNLLWAWRDLVTLLTPIWDSMKTGWTDALTWISAQTQYFTAIMENWWAAHGENILLIVTALWIPIKAAFETGWTVIVGLFNVYMPLILSILSGWMEMLGLITSQAWEFLKTSFANGLEFLGFLVDAFAALLKGDWDTMWYDLKAATGIWWESIKGAFVTGLENVRALVSLAIEIGGDIVSGFVKGIAENSYKVISGIAQVVRDAIQAAKDAAKGHSPSLVFAGIGKDFMLGLAEGIKSYGNLPAIQVAKATTASMIPAMAAQSVSTNNYRTANVNMGGVNINGNMGAAEFEAAIRRVLRSEFSG